MNQVRLFFFLLLLSLLGAGVATAQISEAPDGTLTYKNRITQLAQPYATTAWVGSRLAGKANLSGGNTFSGTQTFTDANNNSTLQLGNTGLVSLRTSAAGESNLYADATNYYFRTNNTGAFSVFGTGNPGILVTGNPGQPIAEFRNSSNVATMRIESNGAISIGTSNSATMSTLLNYRRVANGYVVPLLGYNESTNYLQIGNDGGNYHSGTVITAGNLFSPIIFRLSNAEWARFINGNLLINTTASDNRNYLQVNGSIKGTYLETVGSVPTITAGPASGTGTGAGVAGISSTSNQVAGRFCIIAGEAGSPQANAIAATITFATPTAVAPRAVLLSSEGGGTNFIGLLRVPLGSLSTTGFTINTGGIALGNNNAYCLYYHAVY